VILDGVGLHNQAQCNLAVGQTVNQQFEHLLLATGERRQQLDARRGATSSFAEQLVDQLFQSLVFPLQLVQHLDAVDQNSRLVGQQFQQVGSIFIHARGTWLTAGVDHANKPAAKRQRHHNRRREVARVVGTGLSIRTAMQQHGFAGADVEIDGVLYAESEHEQPGNEIVLSELADGTKLGMSICYDVRFPELYRRLAVGGAEVLVVPSAFTLSTTRDHWEILVRARAIENACFVLAGNQSGSHPPGNRSGGRSLIVDPWGLVLAGAPDVECAICAELELPAVGEVRRRLPALSQRRSDVYG